MRLCSLLMLRRLLAEKLLDCGIRMSELPQVLLAALVLLETNKFCASQTDTCTFDVGLGPWDMFASTPIGICEHAFVTCACVQSLSSPVTTCA